MTNPLKSRTADVVIAAFLFVFVLFNAFVEVPAIFGFQATATSEWALLRWTYWWCAMADRVFLAQPVWAWVAITYHAFGFGPLYAYLSYAFYKRLNSARNLGIVTGAAKLYAGALYIAGNLMDKTDPPASPALFLIQSSSYMIIPALILYRCWDDLPFAPLPSSGDVSTPKTPRGGRPRSTSRTAAEASPKPAAKTTTPRKRSVSVNKRA